MKKLILKYLSIIITIYILSMIIDTIYIGNTTALLFMGIVLLLVNMLIKPFLLLITLPINLLTLGLFTFIVNAWGIMLADCFVSNISIGGFRNSLITSLCIVLANHFLKDKDTKRMNN